MNWLEWMLVIVATGIYFAVGRMLAELFVKSNRFGFKESDHEIIRSIAALFIPAWIVFYTAFRIPLMIGEKLGNLYWNAILEDMSEEEESRLPVRADSFVNNYRFKTIPLTNIDGTYYHHSDVVRMLDAYHGCKTSKPEYVGSLKNIELDRIPA